MEYFNTVSTTRIPYNKAAEMAVEVTRMLWPQVSSLSPKVVVIVPDNDFHYGFTAASLICEPVMGTLLMTAPEQLYSITKEEIVRLSPQGTADIPPVIMVGPFRSKVVKNVEKLGVEVFQIGGKSLFETAANVTRFRNQIPPDSPDGSNSLFVISGEQPYEGLSVPYYSANAGVPVLFTKAKQLPPATAKVLKEMSDKNVYVVGGRRSVADNVLDEINNIIKTPVRRIAGSDPFATAVEFAQYCDPVTKLGWHRTKRGRGDAFAFCNIESWDLAIAAVVMAHYGKYTPLLPIGLEEVPPAVVGYLNYLKPPLATPQRPPFMHGFVLGCADIVSREAQNQIELAIKVDNQLEK